MTAETVRNPERQGLSAAVLGHLAAMGVAGPYQEDLANVFIAPQDSLIMGRPLPDAPPPQVIAEKTCPAETNKHKTHKEDTPKKRGPVIHESDGGPLAWQARGLCIEADPESFFPLDEEGSREAKQFCNRCDVRTQCRDYAISIGASHGVWGGLSEDELRVAKPKSSICN